jgi:hypothetical protein
VKFVTKSPENGQFKAKTKQKTDFRLHGSIVLSRGGRIGANWCNRLGGGEPI